MLSMMGTEYRLIARIILISLNLTRICREGGELPVAGGTCSDMQQDRTSLEFGKPDFRYVDCLASAGNQELHESIEQPALCRAHSGRFSANCDFPGCSS